MNGVGDIERMEVSYYEDFRAIFQSVLRPGIYMDAAMCAREISRKERADENWFDHRRRGGRAIARSINSGTDDGRL